MLGVDKIKESDRKFPGAPQSLTDIINQVSGGGIAGAVTRTALKFVIGHVERAVEENQHIMSDILFNAAQQLEADPRIVEVFGPIVQIQSPELGGEGNQTVSHVVVNGVSKTTFQLQVVVISGSGSSSGTGVSGGRIARGLATIHAISTSGSLEITKLSVDTPRGTIVLFADSTTSGTGTANTGTRRVQGVTTIDVKARD